MNGSIWLFLILSHLIGSGSSVSRDSALIADSFSKTLGSGSLTGFRWILLPDRDEISDEFELTLHGLLEGKTRNGGVSLTFHEETLRAEDLPVESLENEMVVVPHWHADCCPLFFDIREEAQSRQPSWLFFFTNNTFGVEEMIALFEPHLKINSKLFFVAPAENDGSEKELHLWEVYKVFQGGEVITSRIGEIINNEIKLTRSQ